MPPCFSAASATAETASNDNTPAAHACTLRMLPSSIIRPRLGPIFSNDIMAERLRNQQEPVSILALRTNANQCESQTHDATVPADRATNERSQGSLTSAPHTS